MFQIGTILFEQNKQICIITYKILFYLKYLCIRLIKKVDVHVYRPIVKNY